MTKSSSVQAASALKHLPPFPAVASRLITMLNSESVSFQAVADVLKTDAALSAEVLHLANSPLLATSRYEVTGILQALSLLGLKRLAGLVMTLSLSRFLKRAGATQTMRRAWRHNLACALAAGEFAKSFGREPDEAYNAGLFHDLGRLALLAVEPALYDQWTAESGDLRELERSRFGIDHCEAGAWVIEHWNLPQAFIEVALLHHEPKPSAALTMLVNGACTVANRLGFSATPMPPEEIHRDPNDPLGASILRVIESLEAQYGI